MMRTDIEAALAEYAALDAKREDGDLALLEAALFLEDFLPEPLREDEITRDNLGDADALWRFADSKVKP
jgi:hypothetical protein